MMVPPTSEITAATTSSGTSPREAVIRALSGRSYPRTSSSSATTNITTDSDDVSSDSGASTNSSSRSLGFSTSPTTVRSRPSTSTTAPMSA